MREMVYKNVSYMHEWMIDGFRTEISYKGRGRARTTKGPV